MSDDLVTWLRQQLDDEEQRAAAVHLEICSSVNVTLRNGVVWPVGECDCGVPARVLADVAAKRAILDLVAKTRAWTEGMAGATAGYAAVVVDDAVRLLALPYADRPGYLDEWRAAVEPA